MLPLLVLALALPQQAPPQAIVIGTPQLPTLNSGGKWLELELTVPDTPDVLGTPAVPGFVERFALFVPTQPLPSAPLLVHFHAFGGHHLEVGFFTDFLAEAEQRGWFLIAPDQGVPGLFGKTYSNEEAQRRMQAVLDWSVARLPVDRDRIYAYGFSMGGGDVLSYAAQHLDPTGVTFAAIAQNAGTLCLTEEYATNAAAVGALEDAFGGATPGTDRFVYERASSIEYDPLFGIGLDHAALNLTHVPVQSWYSVPGDRLEVQQLAQDLDQVLGANHELHPVQSLYHEWDTFDYTAVCDWFASQRRTVPERGSLVAARDGRYHDLYLERTSTSGFGRVTFDLNVNGGPMTDVITFRGVSNLSMISVDALELGLVRDFTAVLEVDPLFVRTLHVENYGAMPPQSVILNSTNVTAQRGSTWDLVGGTLELRLAPGLSPPTSVWTLH